MPLWSDAESVDNITEEHVLGYFESVRGVFITKIVFLTHLANAAGNSIDPVKLDAHTLSGIRILFPDVLVYDRLTVENEHLYANYVTDIVTSGILGAWIVFEQVIKYLPVPNFAHDTNLLSASYKRGVFGLNPAETRNLDLFYYVRNALVHYNGAYHAYSDIDWNYNGQDFKSVGHHGEKINVSLSTAWRMIADIENYTAKAWGNWLASRAPAQPTQVPQAPPTQAPQTPTAP
jgi:hypothetical protein